MTTIATGSKFKTLGVFQQETQLTQCNTVNHFILVVYQMLNKDKVIYRVALCQLCVLLENALYIPKKRNKIFWRAKWEI